jgi:hypothetical protein
MHMTKLFHILETQTHMCTLLLHHYILNAYHGNAICWIKSKAQIYKNSTRLPLHLKYYMKIIKVKSN